jgi:arsenate reductase
MLKILFLCTGNSCRSQMAEGWARALKADQIEAFSAGLVAHGQNPNAIKVMAEAGVDITGQASKTLASLGDQVFDVVITVCGDADEKCPIFPGGTRKIHHGFDDPPKLAKDAKTEEEALGHYRRVRDEIKAYIQTLPGAVVQAGSAPH